MGSLQNSDQAITDSLLGMRILAAMNRVVKPDCPKIQGYVRLSEEP